MILSPASRRTPRVEAIDQAVVGYWRVYAYPMVNGRTVPVDVTMVRGFPTKIGSFGHEDPFGAKAMTVTFPGVTYLERLGEGDLWWLHKFVPIKLVWDGPLAPSYDYGTIRSAFGPPTQHHAPHRLAPLPRFNWPGRMDSFHWDNKGLTVRCSGELYGLDDYLAEPAYPHSPIPYEWAIASKFLGHPHLRLKPLKIAWPTWWSTFYTPPKKGTPSYLVPSHVTPGQPWLGLVTRQTGSWDAVLSSYINGLLSGMYTPRGRWTLDVFPDAQPLLMHRDILREPDTSTVVVDITDGGNEVTFDEDWTQSISAVFAQGTSLSGVQYSGMQVSPNGMLTSYEPMAALRQVHPESEHNEWLDRSRARREVQLQVQAGLSELQAHEVARAHLERFGDPGMTGTTVLRADPTINGVRVPLALVRSGMSLHMPNLLGRPEGVLAHITANEVDLVEETNTLTWDTKWRDALTVAEVKRRGRDSLSVQRMLVTGAYTPPVNDQLIPWDYATGSGYIPSAPGLSSQQLFDGMPSDIEFPWEPWTTAHPPSNPKWAKCYIKIPAASPNASNNWTFYGSAAAGRLAIPIRMAQAGQIRLVQVAAYDASGHVLPVGFHMSLYSFHGVGVNAMPEIPAGEHYGTFTAHQRYPFGLNAWEKYTAAGTLTDPNIPQPAVTNGLVRGWGDHYERAGYWPGASGAGDPATGLLVDEAAWPFDLTQAINQFNPYSTKQVGPYRGQMYLMLYCDAQGGQPVYFAGRFFRAEPGATS